MLTSHDLIDRYIATWNEPDDARRHAIIAAIWTDDAAYLDPSLQGDGRDGIDAMVKAVHERFPGQRFRRTSDVDAHHDRLRFLWSLGPDAGPPTVQGADFGVRAADGRLSSITGFFDPPQA